MTQDIPASFITQAEICETMGSPLTARVLRLLSQSLNRQTPLGRRLLDWPNDPSGKGDALGLRLAGGLHSLVLDGTAPALASAYASPERHSDPAFLDLLTETFQQHQTRLDSWLDSPPQTNEVRRSAILIAAGHWLTARYGLPLTLSELGASAGLNLIWDRYALEAGNTRLGPDPAVITLRPDWRGASPPQALPVVAARSGVDRNPLNPKSDQLRLMAYLWADQTERLHRTRLACEEAARLACPIDRADAVDWLAQRLANPPAESLHLVFHTVVLQYLPLPAQRQVASLLETAGAKATSKTPLAHFSMEADDTAEPGAALHLRLWPGDVKIPLGRCDFHGRWVDWQAPPP
jgi:hypothetical protein